MHNTFEKNFDNFICITCQACLAMIFLIITGCTTNINKPIVLKKLEKEFGGEWRIGKYDNCILLIVENSKRIDQSPDSIQNYISTINLLTMDWKKDKCLNFEHSVTSGNYNISTTHSKTYIVRP